MGNLGKGQGAGRADTEAEAKELTRLSRLTMTTKATSVLAAKNLIVARGSPGKHRSKDASTPVRSVRTLRGWVGAAGAVGRAARGRGPGRRAGCGRPSVGVLPEEERRRARILLRGALARSLLQRAEPALYTGRLRRRVLQ